MLEESLGFDLLSLEVWKIPYGQIYATLLQRLFQLLMGSETQRRSVLGASSPRRLRIGGTKINAPMSDVLIVNRRSLCRGWNAGLARISCLIRSNTPLTDAAIDTVKGWVSSRAPSKEKADPRNTPAAYGGSHSPSAGSFQGGERQRRGSVPGTAHREGAAN